MAKELTKAEVEKIIKDEIKKFIDKEFAVELKKQLKTSGPVRKEMIDAIRNSHVELAKFLYLRKETFINNIK